MLWFHILFILLLFCVLDVNSSNELRPSNIWRPYTTIDGNCPRFIYVDTSNEGLGDQLERLSMALSLAIKANEQKLSSLYTVIVDDAWKNSSKHRIGGYSQIFQNIFGFPKFDTIQDIKKRYSTTTYSDVGVGVGAGAGAGAGFLKTHRLLLKDYLRHIRRNSEWHGKGKCNLKGFNCKECVYVFDNNLWLWWHILYFHSRFCSRMYYTTLTITLCKYHYRRWFCTLTM